MHFHGEETWALLEILETWKPWCCSSLHARCSKRMHDSAATSPASDSHGAGFQRNALELFTRLIFLDVSNEMHGTLLTDRWCSHATGLERMLLTERILRASQEIQHQPGTSLSREQVWIVPYPWVAIVQQIASKTHSISRVLSKL